MRSGMFKHSLTKQTPFCLVNFLWLFSILKKKEKKPPQNLISKSDTDTAWSNMLLLLFLHE